LMVGVMVSMALAALVAAVFIVLAISQTWARWFMASNMAQHCSWIEWRDSL
jgi:hypothetical protein